MGCCASSNKVEEIHTQEDISNKKALKYHKSMSKRQDIEYEGGTTCDETVRGGETSSNTNTRCSMSKSLSLSPNYEIGGLLLSVPILGKCVVDFVRS